MLDIDKNLTHWMQTLMQSQVRKAGSKTNAGTPGMKRKDELAERTGRLNIQSGGDHCTQEKIHEGKTET